MEISPIKTINVDNNNFDSIQFIKNIWIGAFAILHHKKTLRD